MGTQLSQDGIGKRESLRAENTRLRAENHALKEQVIKFKFQNLRLYEMVHSFRRLMHGVDDTGGTFISYRQIKQRDADT